MTEVMFFRDHTEKLGSLGFTNLEFENFGFKPRNPKPQRWNGTVRAP